jgi:hypothetical protein
MGSGQLSAWAMAGLLILFILYFPYFQFSPGRFFFLVFLGEVKLSSLCTLTINWPIVLPLDDRWWVWSNWWSENRNGKPNYSEKTCPSATLSTKCPTWLGLGSNPGRSGGKPASNRLNCGTTSLQVTLILLLFVLMKFPTGVKQPISPLLTPFYFCLIAREKFQCSKVGRAVSS